MFRFFLLSYPFYVSQAALSRTRYKLIRTRQNVMQITFAQWVKLVKTVCVCCRLILILPILRQTVAVLLMGTQAAPAETTRLEASDDELEFGGQMFRGSA